MTPDFCSPHSEIALLREFMHLMLSKKQPTLATSSCEECSIHKDN